MIEWLRNLVTGQPHFSLPGYLDRWYLIPRNRFFNIYLHRFIGSDRGRDLHDHPWDSLSIRLKGDLVERVRLPETGIEYTHLQGRFTFRRAEHQHRLDLERGPAWTLFLTGPHRREWGFLTSSGWVHWTKYHDVQPEEEPLYV